MVSAVHFGRLFLLALGMLAAGEVLSAESGSGVPAVSAEVVEAAPAADASWPRAIVFLTDDCSFTRPARPTGTSRDSLSLSLFTLRNSRAFSVFDLPTPIKMGRKLCLLEPARPGVRPRVLLQTADGAIGSPSVSFDGQWIYFAMAGSGEAFFHVYRLPAAGGSAQRLTDGPFHDIDPAELPDGRIVFASTRIGTFQEYHAAPSLALFTMRADGSDRRAISPVFNADREPKVLADGRIVFIRADNFLGRAKVEPLLHAVHLDGVEGYTEFGLDLAPDYGQRLRAFACGSPAPLPDGRLAFLSAAGITIGRLGLAKEKALDLPVAAGDVAPLPDGRLLCTVARRGLPSSVLNEERGGAGRDSRSPQPSPDQTPFGARREGSGWSYERLAILDPGSKPARLTTLYESPGMPLHSPVYVGPTRRPPVSAAKVDRAREDDVRATGFFFCQNARNSKNYTGGWPQVRAVRVLAGEGVTTRSSHAPAVHTGSLVTELGTVPLAPDGSFYVEVPADRPIAFQAVDAEGRCEVNEMSWIYVRPGEYRSCLGCHQVRHETPTPGDAYGYALRTRPLKVLGRGDPNRFRGNNAAVNGMMELQLDRYREVASINRQGALTDSSRPGAEEVGPWITELKSEHPSLRISAAQRLGIFRDSTAAPALAERLTDAVREVRVAAATALATCGTRNSVGPLADALADRDPLVAQAAAMALENLTGQPENLGFDPYLDAKARQAETQRWQAWFRKPDWTAIEQDLIGRLETDDRVISRRAAVALGHVGGNSARAALRRYVLAERDNNPYPEWRAAGHRGDRAAFNALSPYNPRALQAAVRSLGYLHDAEAVPLLAETLHRNAQPDTGNLYLAEAAAEALGRIGTPPAEQALLDTFADLKPYTEYAAWYGDHPQLAACHASPLHYYLVEALDWIGSKRAGALAPQLIRSLPTDADRALLLGNDDYETLVGRVLRRNGLEAAATETCLAVLGDQRAATTRELADAFSAVAEAWAGTPPREFRAAEVLSLVCREPKFAPRVRAALQRYAQQTPAASLAVKHWVCFYLARTLGNLADPQSAPALIALVEATPGEAAAGRPNPVEPAVQFLSHETTPCYRAAAAWALGRLGDRSAVPTLLKLVGNLENTIDTRHAAAEALEQLADPAALPDIRRLAADYPEVSTRKVLLRICDRLDR